MFAPLIIRPSTVSREAPTRNFEYGEYENSLARLEFSLEGKRHCDQDTFGTGLDEELLLFDRQRPRPGCSSHLIFSRSITAHLLIS